jgi:phage I-like protein
MTPEKLNLLIELKDGPELPSELLLFANGVTSTKKGPFYFDAASAGSVLAAFDSWGVDRLSFDYDHAAVKSDARAGDGKAAGWFVPVVKDGALYASEIEWTPDAAKMLSAREYRFFSPCFHAEQVTLSDGSKARRVTELLNVALTNMPATRNQRPIVASDPGTTESQPTALVEALKIQAAEVEKLRSELAERNRVELTTEIDAAIHAAKFTPGQRDALVALASKAPAEVRELLRTSAAKFLHLSTPIREKKDADGIELAGDRDERKIAELLGVKP